MNIERRRHIRHKPLKQNAFAALGQSFTKTGRIKDISLGGLSLEYIVGQCIQTEDNSRVEIFLTDMPLHIRNVECHLIYDDPISLPQMKDNSSSSLTFRCTGIRFIMLSEKHREQLNMFINLFCAGPVQQGLYQQRLWM
jgi:c-di-GMP-binding flagellar brake protein YcgR